MQRVRVLQHSIGQVRLVKFIMPPAATRAEIAGVFRRMADDCVERGMRGALVIDEDRPAASQADVKAAVSLLDLSTVPENFRLAVVAFRKPAYDAYRYALATLADSPGRAELFWNELDAVQWLRSQFSQAATSPSLRLG